MGCLFSNGKSKDKIITLCEFDESCKNYLITLINDSITRLNMRGKIKMKCINIMHKTTLSFFFNKSINSGGMIITECNGCLIKDRLVYEYSISFTKCEPKNYDCKQYGEFCNNYCNYYITSCYSNFLSVAKP